MRLLMTVSTALFVPGLFPKKSGAYAMSSSNPKMPRVVPIDAPQLRRFSLQLVRLAQLAESPPKLNPTNGLMKPSARAGVTAQAMSAAARMSIRSGCKASLLFHTDYGSAGGCLQSCIGRDDCYVRSGFSAF